jgi:Tfp pilus assembly protein PilN
MRPVNLIPPEDRRGASAPLRTGPLPYVLVGALVAVLAGVTALVLVGNQISEREGEVATLEREDAQAAAKAQRLAAYTEFREMSEARVATVSDLADSRFDWERVMHELSLVLPEDAWLTSLSASASAGIGGASGGGSGLRAAVPGPALELSGCATGQEAVARFVTMLKDIEGVTRVGVQSSELPDQTEGGGDGGGGSEGGDECRTRAFIAKFEIVVAFDAAPVPVTSGEEAAPVATAEPAAGSEGESSEGDDSEGGSATEGEG